ncbi:MAG: HAD family hydrolase [Candidatus Saccharimonadia bacterium]
MQDKIIGFDLDGTILDHTNNKLRLAELYGYSLIAQQTPSGIMGRFLAPSDMRKVSDRLYGNISDGMKSQLMPGVTNALSRLDEQKLPYFLLSRRQSEIAVALLEHFGLWPKFFGPSNTAFVETMPDKAPYAHEFGITHFLDDHISTLVRPLGFIPHKYLFDPYHLLPSSKAYQKVSSWDEIPQIFDN